VFLEKRILTPGRVFGPPDLYESPDVCVGASVFFSSERVNKS
jgi:hypothetical protein